MISKKSIVSKIGVCLLGVCLCSSAFAFLDFGGQKCDKKSDVDVVIWA